MLVGEIRDKETAVIAIEAALTGHMVLATLHTNSAAATPMRLVEMGIEPFLGHFVVVRCHWPSGWPDVCACIARRPTSQPKADIAAAGWSTEEVEAARRNDRRYSRQWAAQHAANTAIEDGRPWRSCFRMTEEIERSDYRRRIGGRHP